MAPKKQGKSEWVESQGDFGELLREKLKAAVRLTLSEVLEAEVEAFIGAGRYERQTGRRDQRNGYYERNLVTGVGEIENLAVPRTRRGFKTELFDRYQRRQRELDEAMCGMFVSGSSTAQVGQIVEQLTGSQPSPSTVSRVFQGLDAEFEQWRVRPLSDRYLYAFADGTYFSVIYGSEGHKMPILAVTAVTVDGQRELLGFGVGERENQQAWVNLLQDLKARGLATVDLWVSDGHQALINAIGQVYPDSIRQRCVVHKIENVLSYIPKKQQATVKPELRAIFYQPNRDKAAQCLAAFVAKYEAIYPSAVACLQRDLEACLAFYHFPARHWRTIRTNNAIERLFREVKKRSKKMGAAFRNENSCLLLFYAVARSVNFKNISV
jgi:transposase-like protein